MSASDKKKLRKEQNVSELTEKQKAQAKEAKKLKAITVSFVVVMVLIVAIIAGITLRTPVSGALDRGTHAVTVGSRELNTTEFNFFYSEAISQFVGQYSQYGAYAAQYMQMMTGLNPSAPLDEQKMPGTENETWADFFLKEAKNTAKWTFAMYDKAVADGFKLGEEEQKILDDFDNYMKMVAQRQQFSSVKGYLHTQYGNGANLKNYKEHFETQLIAMQYAQKHLEEIKFENSDYREFEKDKYNEFSSYSYYITTLSLYDYHKLLGHGTETKGEDGKTTTTYTKEEDKAAQEAAKKDAEALTAAGNSTIEKFNEAIKALALNKDNKDAKATEVEDVLYNSINNEDIRKWVSDKNRKEGDMTFVEFKVGQGKEEEFSAYYVVMYKGCDENLMKLANVRHMLAAFKGGTKDKDTGKVTYSDAEKAEAKANAEKLLKEWNDGAKTEDSFAEIAKNKSDDTGSKATGGLFEDITPATNFVKPFKDWCMESHKPGDTGIVETEYGYHVMYYVKDGDLTYRDYMINAQMTAEAQQKWEEEAQKDIEVTEHNLSRIETDLVLAG